MLFGPAGRDGADDFFAISVLSIRVGNQQDNGRVRLNADFPDRVPPLFSRPVDSVAANEAAFVLRPAPPAQKRFRRT